MTVTRAGIFCTVPPPYFPYPPGIVPSDIESEINRVRREVRGIFNQYLQQWQKLPPLQFESQPPILQGTGFEAIRILGGLMNYDEKISPFKDIACASCHMPYAAFSGPIPSVNLTMIAYAGSYHYRAAKRTAMRYTYSPFFPSLNYDPTSGAFTGGNFWDGRATGYLLRSPDAEQAQHPPVDPLKMGNPDTACIAYKLSLAVYRPLFEEIWGADSLNIKWPPSAAQICATPEGAAVFGTNANPIPLSPDDRSKAENDYDHWAQAISALEKSADISPFTSKFDSYIHGAATAKVGSSTSSGSKPYTFTADEMAGYELFNGKGNCNSCHLDGLSTTLTSNQTDTGTPASQAPAFTCFGYANEGLPLNPRIALFYETKPDFFGYTPNPYGFGYRDLGLGNFLRSGFGSGPNPNSNWIQYAPASDGQFQVMTARDVAFAPPQCPTTEAGQTDSNGKPAPYFQKEFFHNGYIKSLKQLVHFYNTRDVYPYNVTSGHCPPGTTEG
jgi:cytochrome c peroxidase